MYNFIIIIVSKLWRCSNKLYVTYVCLIFSFGSKFKEKNTLPFLENTLRREFVPIL